jgi:phosphate starvation-inducible protein PhoH
MYALQRLFAERYRVEAVTTGRAVFGFGVLFPDIDWDLDTPEAPAAITADRTMLMTPAAVTRYLKHLTTYWRDKKPHATSLSFDDLRLIRAKLRPDVDVYPPLSLRIGVALHEMQHLTDEQYERLECIEQNERTIVSGGAGTGKTFLLMQLARRQAALGRKVLVVVHSELLAAFLRRTAMARGFESCHSILLPARRNSRLTFCSSMRVSS